MLVDIFWGIAVVAAMATGFLIGIITAYADVRKILENDEENQ